MKMVTMGITLKGDIKLRDILTIKILDDDGGIVVYAIGDRELTIFFSSKEKRDKAYDLLTKMIELGL